MPYDFCEKHKRQMTGFTTLFCPDCERENDVQKMKDINDIMRAYSANVANFFRPGERVTIRGVLAFYHHNEAAGVLTGGLVRSGLLVWFRTKQEQIFNLLNEPRAFILSTVVLTGIVQELPKAVRPKSIVDAEVLRVVYDS